MNNLASQKNLNTKEKEANGMFTTEDKIQLEERGITLDIGLKQIERFQKGFKPIQLSRAAVVGDGILQLSIEEMDHAENLFDNYSGSVSKFVPSSGVATRMFKELFEFRANGEDREFDVAKLILERGNVFSFFKNIKSFAFYAHLKSAFEKTNKESIEEALQRPDEYRKVLDTLLENSGLNYGNLPKGLLAFHRYRNETRTPAVEQLIEGLGHSPKKTGIHFHFTVSPEYLNTFQKHLRKEVDKFGTNKGVRISYSNQKPSTDILAVDLENQLVRDNLGKILFRPAGHGALLENLNQMEEEVVFIKNIDNVLPDYLKPELVRFKRLLAGVLIGYQEKGFNLLRRNDQKENIEMEGMALLKQLGIRGITTTEVVETLNRPIRVCGMVKNVGEPGGGPFWVREFGEIESLHIVEEAQVDRGNSSQHKIFKGATHFNPVDLVCGLKNYRGEKFDLLKLRDDEAGFITEKSHGGRKLKAMELPGLWNGSMAHWNTIFVEVPLSTFSPVKTINDLLKKEHQPQL